MCSHLRSSSVVALDILSGIGSGFVRWSEIRSQILRTTCSIYVIYVVIVEKRLRSLERSVKKTRDILKSDYEL